MKISHEVGTHEYYIELIQQCSEGCQRCFECPLVICNDNKHQYRLLALHKTIMDYIQLSFTQQKKIDRLNELNESAMAVTRARQKELAEYRERLVRLDRAIEEADKVVDDDFDSLSEQEAYVAGLERARQIMGELKDEGVSEESVGGRSNSS